MTPSVDSTYLKRCTAVKAQRNQQWTDRRNDRIALAVVEEEGPNNPNYFAELVSFCVITLST